MLLTGLSTAPEIVTNLPAEESAMTLIPERDWGKIDDASTNTTSTWSSSKIASEIVGTKTQYAGSRSVDINTGGKLTFIFSSTYSNSSGCYISLSNANTEPTLLYLGGHPQKYFSVTATHKSNSIDTITVTTQGDEYSWFILQF